MSSTTTTSKGTQQPALARVAFASFIGTAIEWYDFFLFGICSALVFPKLFFPNSDPTNALLASFATFGVAFVARPLGAVVFGHFGDTIGRKSALISTLLLMGIATVLIGCVPAYAIAGVWAPAALVVLRFLQGIALGGEWGGAVLLAVEHAPAKKRGLFGVFSQIGNPAGWFLMNAVMQIILMVYSEEAFLQWGWRIAFWASGILVLVGLYIRVGLSDPKVFEEAKASKTEKAMPIVEFFRDHWRNLLITVFMQVPFAVGAYALITYYAAYAKQLGLPASWVLISGMVGPVVSIPFYFLYAIASDRFGRKAVYIVGTLGWLLVSFPFYWLVNTQTLAGIIAASSLAWCFGHAATYAVLSSLIAEQFPTEVRYTGVAVSANLAALIFGATANFIAVWLVSWTGSVYSVSAFVALAGFIGFISTLALKDNSAERLAVVGTGVNARPARSAPRGAQVSSMANLTVPPGA
jgi:MFS transporter, MHS family, shikimate and dehydroshikimate transport protein